jgi:hypothetical protein
MNENCERNCRTCGFVAVYAENRNPNFPGPPLFLEMSDWLRETGHIQHPAVSAHLGYVNGKPGCAAFAQPIGDEYDAAYKAEFKADSPSPRETEIVLKVINSPRQCESWIKYRPGFSPKEHLEERKAAEAERNRREWEIKQEVERRRWHDEEESDRRKWYADHAAHYDKVVESRQQQRDHAENRERRLNWTITIGFLILAVVGLTADSIVIKAVVWLWSQFSS